MRTFNLEIVTPTQILKTDNVSYLRCPGVDGLFGVLSGHRDALIALSLGEIKISQDKSDTIYATSCLLYTSPSPRDKRQSRMPSSA